MFNIINLFKAIKEYRQQTIIQKLNDNFYYQDLELPAFEEYKQNYYVVIEDGEDENEYCN